MFLVCPLVRTKRAFRYFRPSRPCVDTLYVATAGGLGPGTLEGLRRLLGALATDPAAMLVIATDADRAGANYAEQLAALAAEVPLPCARLLPPNGVNDWNDALRSMNCDRSMPT